MTRPQSQTLHLIYSTRDARKSEDTLRRLNAHFQNTIKDASRKTPGISLLLEPRVKLEGVLVDLTRLSTIKSLAKQLLLRKQHLDAIVWNAGLAGWRGINYPLATWNLLTSMIQATTYPRFMICDVGLLADRQLAGYNKLHTFEEPRLGQVFCANVFGHYMLTHWLSPLMDGESRIVSVSSISALPETFSVDDIQGLRSEAAYESSKRLTDYLFITSDLPSTQAQVNAFLPGPPERSSEKLSTHANRPQLIITHPGVVATSITGLNVFLSFWMVLAMYVSRWVGSPWHAVTPYKGALAAVYAVLSPPSQLPELEKQEGKGKWGTATDVFGNERVARMEIEGWGFGGEMGSVPSGSLATRRPGYLKVTKEMREDFEDTGRKVWIEMEDLRIQWEKRLGRMDVDAADSVDV